MKILPIYNRVSHKYNTQNVSFQNNKNSSRRSRFLAEKDIDKIIKETIYSDSGNANYVLTTPQMIAVRSALNNIQTQTELINNMLANAVENHG